MKGLHNYRKRLLREKKQHCREDLVMKLFMSADVLQEQFQFALSAVAEEVHAILKAMPQ